MSQGLFWGQLADEIGLHATLLTAAVTLFSTLALSFFSPKEEGAA